MKINYKFLILPVFFILGGCSHNTESSNSEKQPDESIVELTPEQLKTIGGVDFQTLGIPLKTDNLERTTGTVEVPPQNASIIHVPLGGYLVKTQMLPGYKVTKGQTIAIVEDMQYIQLQQEYLQTKSELEFAKAEFQRQKLLLESQSTSEKVFQESKMNYETKQVMVNALAQKVELLGIDPLTLTAASIRKSINLKSPFTGFVSSVNAKVGKYYSPTDEMAEIMNNEDLHLVATIYEKDMNNFSIGTKVMAYSNENPSKKYFAQVVQLNPHIGSDRRTEIHCHFEEVYKELHSGMYLNVEFETNSQLAYRVNPNAVVKNDNQSYVFIPLSKTKFKAVPVIVVDENPNTVGIQFIENQKYSSIVLKGANDLLMQWKKED